MFPAIIIVCTFTVRFLKQKIYIHSPVAPEFVQTWQVQGLKQSSVRSGFAARAKGEVSGHSRRDRCFTACHHFPRSLLLTAAVQRKTARREESSVARILSKTFLAPSFQKRFSHHQVYFQNEHFLNLHTDIFYSVAYTGNRQICLKQYP